MHGWVYIHLYQPHLWQHETILNNGTLGTSKVWRYTNVLAEPSVLYIGGSFGKTSEVGGSHIELAVQHELKPQEVKETNSVAQLVSYTLETRGHDGLHLPLRGVMGGELG